MDNGSTLLRDTAASLWERFGSWEVPVHSLLVSKGGELLWERYGEPYRADTLHRMFSVTKSYCSLAIGQLCAEGRLSLDDPIIRFFPEYLPKDGPVHPYLAGMTIRHMLTMQTCHTSTTYKAHMDQNWVESFFTTPPSHRSGQIFLYDTSSSHTLAALVKKLTGLGVLDYLRGCYLDSIGFSKEAYIIPDPFGSEMGGSGLMARPMDLMVTAQYLMEQICRGTGAYGDYLREATRFQTPTLHSGQTLDEQQGYGYQFWQIRGGFAMYGMGGQYVLFYPQADLILVITADAQNIKGGTQKILDAVHDALLPCLGAAGGGPAAPDAALGGTGLTGSGLCCSGPQNSGPRNSGPRSSGPHAPFCASCRLLPCSGGFTRLSLTAGEDGGLLTLEHPEALYRIPFGYDALQTSVLARYEAPIASSGQWLSEDTLFIRTQLCGESVGSLSFLLRFRSDGLTLWMKKVEETYFQEFDGFAEGLLEN